MKYTAQEVRDRWVEMVIPDPYCQKCKFRSYASGPRQDQEESCMDQAGYRMPCESCKTRRPYARAAQVPLDKLQAYLDKTQDAFLIEHALEELLS